MTVLTLLAVLIVGQPDRPGDLAQIHDLPRAPVAAAPGVERQPQAAPPGDPTSSGSGVPPSPGPEDPVKAEAHRVMADLSRLDEWNCMYAIFDAESTWNPDGVGDQTIGGSVGLGQRHIPVWGDPRPWTIKEQVAWFTSYADDRYGGWCPARDRWADRAYDVVDGRMIGGWW